MPSLRVSEWRKLPLSLTELCIDTTLRCGQSFRWRKTDDEWHMVLHGRLLSLKQDETHLHYKTTWPSKIPPGTEDQLLLVKQEALPPKDWVLVNTEDIIRHYFSLKHDAGALYEQWSQNDANFRRKAPRFTGIRILSQDAWEALIGFICSSNNNISRISQMVHKLCLHYGPPVARIEGGGGESEVLHDFPDAAALAGAGVEAHLRQLGFGYRAKYIAETARIVSQERPPEWLESLTNPDNPGLGADEKYGKLDRATYREAHEQLLALAGVGPKVADCVCLMGLGWGEAVPVDTHVWQIAQRDYRLGGAKSKTFSKAMYDAVGDHFRGIWGSQAGWAQSVLFTANLKTFSDRPAAAAKPEELPGVKIEVEEKIVLEEAKPKTKRKRAVLTETVKVESVSVKVEDDGDVKRRRTRSSTRK